MAERDVETVGAAADARQRLTMISESDQPDGTLTSEAAFHPHTEQSTAPAAISNPKCVIEAGGKDFAIEQRIR